MVHEESLLVRQMKDGVEAAWRKVYDLHYAFLCNVANGYVRDEYVAETIVGDTLVHVYEIRDSFCPEGSLRSYLFMAVRNRCVNWLRQNADKLRLGVSAAEDRPSVEQRDNSEEPVSRLIEQDLQAEIYRAIDRLPHECRLVFGKSRFENKTYAEIAAELGISINTVRYHMKNALVQLHTDLDKYLLTVFIAIIVKM